MKRMFRGDAPAIAQVTRLKPPAGIGQVAIGILGTGKALTFAAWNAATVAAAWNASAWPEFMEATASVDINGLDVLLTSDLAGRPFYVFATVGGNSFASCVQTITPVNVTGGLATCMFKAQTTGTFNPITETAAGLATLFLALGGGVVQAGDMTWTGPTGGPWTVAFGGRYAFQPVPLITVDSSALTGGVSAQDEKQRLSFPAGASDPVTFQLRRPDTLQTTAVITTPVSAATIQTDLAAIGYTTTCTGGPLTASGTHTEYESGVQYGLYNTSELVTPTFRVGYVDGLLTTGLAMITIAQPQGRTIESAIIRLWWDAGGSGMPVTGTVKAVAADIPTWPANQAAAAANTLTTASTAFNITQPIGPTDGVNLDVTTIVQEIINRAGWVNQILFYFVPDATPYALHFEQMDLTITTSTAPAITIEWTGGNANQDIPQLLAIMGGSYTIAPIITTIQDGHPGLSPLLIVAMAVTGGESLIIRDDIRSRGPNHLDDPLNWEPEDALTFGPIQKGDAMFIESGKVDLLWGLKQRAGFTALIASNMLHITDVQHFWPGQAVEVMSDNTLPAGLAANTTYYILGIDGPYLQLSTTLNGAPVTLTTAGTGNHTIGIRLISAEIQARWNGKLGIPRLNTSNRTYFEYRERYLSFWCPAIKLGTGIGGGSNRVNLDTGIIAVALQAILSGGSIETGVNAILWKGVNVANELENISADLGIAIFPEETASFDALSQRGGSCTLGRGVTGNSIDKTGGNINSLGAVIAGQLLLN